MLPSDWLAYLPDSAAAGLIADSFAKLFSRFHWVSIFSALLLATLVWAWQRRQLPPGARKGLAAFLFPRRIWLHRSALLDYRFVLIDKVLLASAIGVIALVIVPGGNEAAFALGDDLVDEVAKEIGEDFSASPWLLLGYTASLLVAEDFLRYWAHRLMHSSSLL